MNIVCLLTWEGLSIRKLCPGIAFLIVYRQPVKIFIRKKEKNYEKKVARMANQQNVKFLMVMNNILKC